MAQRISGKQGATTPTPTRRASRTARERRAEAKADLVANFVPLTGRAPELPGLVGGLLLQAGHSARSHGSEVMRATHEASALAVACAVTAGRALATHPLPRRLAALMGVAAGEFVRSVDLLQLLWTVEVESPRHDRAHPAYDVGPRESVERQRDTATVSDCILARAADQQDRDAQLGPRVHVTSPVRQGHPSARLLQDVAVTPTLRVGLAEARGARPIMQDACVLRHFSNQSMTVLGLCDGHGARGERVSAAVAKLAPVALADRVAALSPKQRQSPTRVCRALKNAIAPRSDASVDEREQSVLARLANSGLALGYSGTTALFAVLLPEGLYMVNLGDSRALLLTDGGAVRRLTVDQQASDPIEQFKLAQAGQIVAGGRVNGTLAVARALGDDEVQPLRRPQVTFVPVADLTHATLVIGCDGVFDVTSDADAAAVVRQTSGSPSECAGALVDRAWHFGSMDNLSAMVVGL